MTQRCLSYILTVNKAAVGSDLFHADSKNLVSMTGLGYNVDTPNTFALSSGGVFLNAAQASKYFIFVRNTGIKFHKESFVKY